MSDDIEDVSFLPGAHIGNKKSSYTPNSLQRCQQFACSRNRAILIVALFVGLIFIIALIAAFARTSMPQPACESSNHSPTAETHVAVTTVATATTVEPFPWHNIRLPDTIMPMTYDLFMHPNLTTFNFTGQVNISVIAKKPTDVVIFHIKELKVTSHELYQVTSDGNVIEKLKIVGSSENVKHEQFCLKLNASLIEQRLYQLRLGFSGSLTDSLAGFYRSSYETKAGEKRWLATTHFEPTDARAAFPCFDEPELKANFSLSIVREPHQRALFNTEKIGERDFERGRLKVDKFATTVMMSTYLVAFVVCDFANNTAVTSSGIQVSIYAPAELIDQTDYALYIAKNTLEFYETYYGIKYPLTKSDHIAIPDFSAGAMENWGLITYLMRSLLYNPKESSASDKQWVALVVAHELAHQWFGNLVTMKWWNDLWLNEGFARFLECIGTNHSEPGFQMMDVFIEDALTVALYSDGLATSHPISVPVEDPSEIGEIFDSISYEKGASVIRMLESFVGSHIFLRGLQSYLLKHKYANAETKDLWAAIMEEYQSNRDLANNINIEEVMNTWTLQMGYPVITIHASARTIGATQERFLFNPRGNQTEEFTSPYGYIWYVPLTYITSRDPRKPSAVTWMQKSNVTFNLPTLDQNYKWIKFNANTTGVYRVHYDNENWQALIAQLQRNHTVFSVADRAGLLSDAFALARSGHIDATVALNMSQYLINEVEFVPWQIALASLGYIGGLLEGHPDYKYFKMFMQVLTSNIRSRLGWDDAGDHLTQLLRASVLSDSVYRGDEESIANVKKMFSNWSNGTQSVPANLKSVVYVGGVKYGGDAEWQFVWNRFERTQTPSEKSKLLVALSASSDVLILNRFLKLSLNESVIRSSETPSILQLVAVNPSGRVLAWRFVRSHWNVLYARYHNVMMKMRRIIQGVTSHFTTKFDFEEVKSFFQEKLRGENVRSVSQTLEKISLNMDWLARNENTVMDWLKTWWKTRQQLPN
jgi:glutamyl aminopeptidase